MSSSASSAALPQAQRGLASSTEKNSYRYGRLYFNSFATHKGIDPFDQLIEDDNMEVLCNIDTWREWAYWLHTTGRQISSDTKHIESGAALSYLSSMTKSCSQKWPHHPTWQANSFNTWYQDIRRDIVNVIGRREIREGDDDGEDLQDLDRTMVIKAVKKWNENGSQDAIMKACSITYTYLCVGRSGEFGFLSGKDTQHSYHCTQS